MAENLDLALACSELGGDLRITTAEVDEAISAPTRAVVTGLSRDDLDGAAAIGAAATLDVRVDGAAVRRIHLVVTGFRFEGVLEGGRRRYTVELAHELQLLQMRSDVRIFQDKDAKQIVLDVLHGAGIPDGRIELSIVRTLVPRVYCVQYREPDFDFVSRLLEHEGIFYFVRDEDAASKLVLADSDTPFEPIAGDTALPLLDDDVHGEGVLEFALETAASPGRVALNDYNLMTPSADLSAEKRATGSFTGDWFEYPGGYETPSEGQALAALRMEELLAGREIGRGRSNVLALAAGRIFALDQAAQEALNQRYVLRRVSHRFLVRPREDAGGDVHDTRDVHYENHFECFPKAAAFRPPRRTPRAHVRGVHAVVTTGPPGAEIHTDEIGRTKAKLFWDRVGQADDTSSCWMRVVQPPLGGAMALARVGWEMAVAYVDGDPDRPVAIARLYNAEKTSPYAYPAAKTRLALQTPSSPGGGKSNEIRMEDGAGGQELFVNASKDHMAETGHDKTETVGGNERREIGAASQRDVVASQKVSIGGDQTLTVSGAATLTVTADRTKRVGGTETVSASRDIGANVTGSDTEITGGSHTTLAALGVSRTSVGSHSLSVAGSMIDAAGLGVGVVVAGARAETVGGSKITAAAGPVGESVFGAYANTVAGVCVHAAGGARSGTTKGVSALSVGGVVLANAAGQVTIKAKKVSIRVLGVANLLGGGGMLTLTPGSASFVGIVGLEASGAINISGNPNLVG